MKRGQKYVNSNFGGGGGGAHNRGAKCPVTHQVGHMLGGVWGHAPPETFEILYPLKSVFLQYEQQFTQFYSKSF